MRVIRGFKDQGIVACFEEPNTTGHPLDFDAPRNAPAKNPAAHVASVYWHSDFFQYELAMPLQTVSVSHPSLAGRVQVYGGDSFWVQLPEVQGWGRSGTAERTLVTHSLGYEPLAYVVWNGLLVTPGTIVQTESNGRARSVCAFVTSSVVGLFETMNSSNTALSAVSRTYQVLIFRQPAADAGKPLFGRVGSDVVIGRGKIDTSKQYMHAVAPGETPYVIPQGPIGDIGNGRARIAVGSNVITETDYVGSFTGPSFLTIGV
ncbi:hypothetical protein [Pelagibacterium sediminicola]|uniref:hypothetical protein n=1 Tax=Pelagibacterium sediminicola TaxID=2248761 RepID=UPI000E31F293|nr:hypothetical protein [Pelagibacterium sediminicola]